MCDTQFERVLFYYGEWQEAYRTEYRVSNCQIEFREGLPNNSDYSGDNHVKKLILIDDLMRESNSVIMDLFTKGSHHKNISVIFITQNVFHQAKGMRDIHLNCNYLIVFKNMRDRSQILHLARQVYPEDPKFVQESYADATSPSYGYLLMDFKQSTPDEIRFRTQIFPDDPNHVVYLPKLRFR